MLTLIYFITCLLLYSHLHVVHYSRSILELIAIFQLVRDMCLLLRCVQHTCSLGIQESMYFQGARTAQWSAADNDRICLMDAPRATPRSHITSAANLLVCTCSY